MLLFSTASAEEKYHATLDVPDDGEICPMTLEPIAEYELACAPGATIDPLQPLAKRLTLECGHVYSAMACMYHFAKNELKCPLCRQGYVSKMSPTCIPLHIRDSIMGHAQQQWDKDRTEQEMDNYQTSVSMMLTDLQTNFFVFNDNNTVVLVVYCFETANALAPIISFDFEMRMCLDQDILNFQLSRQSLRMLSTNLRQCYPMSFMQLCIGIRCNNEDFVFLDRSLKTHIDNCVPRLCVAGRHGAQFDLMASEDDLGMVSFYECSWKIGSNDFIAALGQTHNNFV